MQRKNSGENLWEKKIRQFEQELIREEKSSTTIRKYIHDVRQFCLWLSQNGAETGKITKELTIAYKQDLMDHYRVSSVNSMVAAVNRFLRFCGMDRMCIKTCRTQRQYFRKEEEELTKEEYLLLVKTAESTGRPRLKLLMQTLACTGIRVQELTSVTVEHVREGKLEIYSKGKWREVYLPKKLREELLSYCADNGISQGPVFLTFSGQVPDRVNIWYMLKRLARRAGVEEQKVYPHNFRHLFARSYYEISRDIAHLADLLGHSNVETTRRYTLETVQAEEETLERMGLI